MNENTLKPQVIHQWDLPKIALLFGLAVAIGLGVIGVSLSQDVRSKATSMRPSPTPLAIVQSPPSDLTPPYIRLVTKSTEVQVGVSILFDIYIDTAGKEVVEADLVLSYPDEILEFDINVKNADVFKSVQVSDDPETLVTFFVTPTTGQKPIVTQGEQKIGTISFKAKAAHENVTLGIEFDKNKPETSALILYTETRIETPTNLLEKGSQITFSIVP